MSWYVLLLIDTDSYWYFRGVVWIVTDRHVSPPGVVSQLLTPSKMCRSPIGTKILFSLSWTMWADAAVLRTTSICAGAGMTVHMSFRRHDEPLGSSRISRSQTWRDHTRSQHKANVPQVVESQVAELGLSILRATFSGLSGSGR
jgi:hypothetical protein